MFVSKNSQKKTKKSKNLHVKNRLRLKSPKKHRSSNRNKTLLYILAVTNNIS